MGRPQGRAGYHAGGLRPEQIANFRTIQAIALGGREGVMKLKNLTLIILLGLTFVLFGCGGEETARQVALQLRAAIIEDEQLIDKNIEMQTKFYERQRETIENSRAPNILVPLEKQRRERSAIAATAMSSSPQQEARLSNFVDYLEDANDQEANRNRAEIKCGDVLRITHDATGAHLHSHAIDYKHPGTSGQQQITAYKGTDDNDLWIVRSPCTDPVRNGGQIKLEHAATQRYLHSHPKIPAPATPSQQEVTGFGGGGQTDEGDLWKVEVAGGGVWTTNKRVRLIHVTTNVALHSHAISHDTLPPGQQEVTGYSGRDDNDFWTATAVGGGPPPRPPAKLGFRRFCCDQTTEEGADEVYFILVGKSNNGREVFQRLPGSSNHWNMNDGDQGTKPASGYEGDAHCIDDGTLFSDIRSGETWSFAILIMEEDGGTSKKYQELASRALALVDDPYARAAGTILGVLTKLGLFATDTDDYIGSFGVRVTYSGGPPSATWQSGDRVSGSQNDPDAPHNANRHEFRFNGDGSNDVGWFYIR